MKPCHALIIAGLSCLVLACSADNDKNQPMDNPNQNNNDVGNGTPISTELLPSGEALDCSGLAPESGTDDPDEVCEIHYPIPSCKRCSAKHCNDSCINFSALPSSEDYQWCLAGCSDTACIDDCGKEFPSENNAYEAYMLCMDCSCKLECRGSDGPRCSFPSQPAECAECAPTACSDLCDSLNSKPDAWRFTQCASQCYDSAECVQYCERMFPIAGGEFQGYRECLLDSCETECKISHSCDLGNGLTPCTGCLSFHCMPQCQQAMISHETYGVCDGSCKSEECHAQCDAEFPGAAESYSSFWECSIANCGYWCGAATP